MDIENAFKDLLECASSLPLSDSILFFESILFESEKNDIAIRWAILNDLQKAISQRKIAEKYNCSLQKVSNCMALLKNKNDIVSQFLQYRYDETVR